MPYTQDPNGNISFGEDILLEDIQLMECVAVGGKAKSSDWSIECLGLCQRPENPCIVDIDYKITGDGIFEFVPELTAFSLDTTDGIDGTWHILQAIETDPLFSGLAVESRGSFQGRYVADLCDHISSFFSELKICVRLTVRLREALPPQTSPSGDACVPGSGVYCQPGGSIPPGTRLPTN